MTWDYRILKFKDNYGFYYEICEVYYDRSGKPKTWCAANICGESLQEIECDWEAKRKAFDQAVLDSIEDFKKPKRQVEEGSGNVFADMRLPNASKELERAERKLKQEKKNG